jgi:2',3'-cyclic-nucleotide 2'-phosphodiesterase (5'-nucleotidase family)
MAVQNRTTSPARCWIPVLVNLGHDPQGFQQVIDAITEFEYPPQVIIDVTGNNETYANMTRIRDTWVFSKSYDERSFFQHRLFLSPDKTQVRHVTFVEESMSEIPDPIQNDKEYASDIAFLRQLADEAATNDPVVGTSQEMPVVRNTPYTPCRGGECPAGNLFADAIRWKANASVAFVNSGGIRGDGWPEGDVRMSNIWNTLPFANTLCEATLSGLSLFRVFNFSTSIATFEGDYTPEGDRLFQVSGIRITYNTQLPNSRLISIFLRQ